MDQEGDGLMELAAVATLVTTVALLGVAAIAVRGIIEIGKKVYRA